MVLARLARKTARLSFRPGQAVDRGACSCVAEPEVRGSAPKDTDVARDNIVELMEREISSRFKAADGAAKRSAAGATRPALSIFGEARECDESTSTQAGPQSDGCSSESTSTGGFGLIPSGCGSEVVGKETLWAGKAPATREVDELRRFDSRTQVQQTFTALTQFLDEDQVPSSDGSSRQRSQSVESLDDFGDEDHSPEGAPARPPQDDSPEGHQPNRRRSNTSPAEWTTVGAEAEAKADAEARRHRRGNSIDCGKPLRDLGGRAKASEAQVLRKLGMRSLEVGSRNETKWTRRTMWNQCFYLSLAHAYMGAGANERHTKRLARRLRKAIEAAVLEKHPSWSQGLRDSAAGTGPAMVFADFLQIAMQADGVPKESNFLSKLAVCVVDSAGGHAEVYLGPLYNELTSRAEQEKNFLLLLHVPGHYCCLVRNDAEGSQIGMTYQEFKEVLVKRDVMHIETTA